MDPDAGLNLRLGFTSYALDATLNPDFSQVESDDGQVTVNERFALFFPEKRPFFLEGIELFGSPQTLVYTRRIVNPKAGAKLTGKFGQLGVAHLTAVDETDAGDAWFNITRLRRDFGRNSIAGRDLHQPRPGEPPQPRPRGRLPLRLGAVLHPVPARRLGHPRRGGQPHRADLAGGIRPHRALVGLQLPGEGTRRAASTTRRGS